MTFWDVYPDSGRTNWIGGARSDLPGGVGWAYQIWTTGATGIYAHYNTPRTLLHTGNGGPDDIRWIETPDPPAPILSTAISMKHPSGNFNKEWNIFIDTGVEVTSLTSLKEFTLQMLRANFTLPRPNEPNGPFLPDFPNGWTLQPLTKEQYTLLTA